MCVNDFVCFYVCSDNWFWNCSDYVVYFVWHYIGWILFSVK
jgi:hypothetical protein